MKIFYLLILGFLFSTEMAVSATLNSETKEFSKIDGRYYNNGQIRSVVISKNGCLEHGVVLNEDGSVALDGSWEYRDKMGRLVEKGVVKKGLPDGVWEEYSDGKLRVKSHFNMGKANGAVEIYFDDGQLQSKQFYQNCMADGMFQEYAQDGFLKYDGLIKDGHFFGIRRGIGFDGSIFEIPLQNDEIEGIEKIYDKDGKLKQEFTYKKGILNGPAKVYSEKGDLLREGNFENGLQSGLQQSYYEGKLTRKSQFVSNVEVEFSSYDEKGNVAFKMQYDKDMGNIDWTVYDGDGSIITDGEVKRYYDNGQLFYFAFVKDGKLDGVARAYYKTGILMNETTFKNGKKEGISKSFYEDGTLANETDYINHKKDGLSKQYDKDGKMKSKFFYRNDLLDGVSEFYDSEGRVVHRENYKDGKPLR